MAQQYPDYGMNVEMGMPQGPRPTNRPNWGNYGNAPAAPRPTYQSSPYNAPSPWQPAPPTPARNPGTPANTTPWAADVPQSVTGWDTQPKRDQYSQYLSSMLPAQQLQQNQAQYGQDFNEAQRRWNDQFGWQQQSDRYTMDLSGRQQQMAEWTAQEASRQWNNQFGWQQRNDEFSQGLADRQYGQQERQIQGQLNLEGQRVGLEGQKLAIENAYNQGRLSNEQRQLALGELTQQQDAAYRNRQLAETMGWNREELAATSAYRAQQDALARAQMAQEAQMQAAQLEAARQNAILQATGRNVAPNVRWMRRN